MEAAKSSRIRSAWGCHTAISQVSTLLQVPQPLLPGVAGADLSYLYIL